MSFVFARGNNDDVLRPIRRGISLLDDTSTVNNTSDGETFASDDPFSLLHELDGASERSKFLNDDDSSRIGNNTRSWSTGGSTYEETPFMTSKRIDEGENPVPLNSADEASSDLFYEIFNEGKISYEENRFLPSPKIDKKDKTLGIEQNEHFSAAPGKLVNDASGEKNEQFSTAPDKLGNDSSDHSKKRNNDYACEMFIENQFVLDKTRTQVKGYANSFFREGNKFVYCTIVAVKTAFGFCVDQVDGVLIRIFDGKNNETDNKNIKNKKDLNSSSAISEENCESKEINIIKKEKNPISIVGSKTTEDISVQYSDFKDDINNAHRDSFDSERESQITPGLSRDSANESILRLKESLYNPLENKNKNQSRSTETTGFRGIGQNIKEEERNDESLSHERTSNEKELIDLEGLSISHNTPLNGFRKKNLTKTDQLNGVNHVSHFNTVLEEDVRVPMSKAEYVLPHVGQRSQMLGEEEIDSLARRRKTKTETMQRLNSSPYRPPTIESSGYCDNDFGQNITRIQRLKLQAQTKGTSEIPIDLTMIENIF